MDTAEHGRRGSNVVVVVGMHRSTTSVASRLINILGVHLGSDADLMPPGPDNPTGYWEHRAIKELDDELLAQLGGSWDQPPVLEDGWSSDPALEPLRERGRSIVDALAESRPSSDPLIGWKDPRTSLLLPFWETVVPIAHVVVVVRDPDEVAASLHRRNGFEPAQSALLWLRYLLAALHDSTDPLVVTHEALLGELDTTIDRLAAHLLLPAPSDVARRDATAHLDQDLRHHHGEAVPRAKDPISVLARTVWNDGQIDPGVIDSTVRDAIRCGWLRPPCDTALLDRSRARQVKMEATMRRRSRARHAQTTIPDDGTGT